MAYSPSIFPVFSQLALDKNVLQGIVFDLVNAEEGFVADKIFEEVGVGGPKKQGVQPANFAGTILRGKLDSWYGNPARDGYVNWGSEPINVEGAQLDPLTYKTSKSYFECSTPREVVAVMEAQGVKGMARAMRPAFEQLRLARERRYADFCTTAANWNTSANLAITAGSEWDSATPGNPIEDIFGVVRKLSKFRKPDTMVLGVDAAFALMANTNFLSLTELKDRQGLATRDEMIKLLENRFGFKKILIAEANANTSKNKTPNIANIWGDNVWIGFTGDPSFSSDSTISAGSVAGVSVIAEPITLEGDVDKRTQSFISRCWLQEDLVTIHAELGAVISNCCA